MARTKKASKTVTKTKVSEAAKKVADAVTKKTAAPKKGTTVETKTNIVLQFAGKELSYDELIQNAKNVFQYDMAGDPASAKEISLFVKPEEAKVYFVIDGTEGSYDL